MRHIATIKTVTVGFEKLYQVWIDGEFCCSFKTINDLLSFLNVSNLVEVWA